MYNYILIILSLIRLGDGTQKIDSYLWHQVQVDRPCGVGNIYKTTLDIGLLDCALLCMLEQPRCMAFNFNIFKICTLFNGSVNAFYTQTNYCQFYQVCLVGTIKWFIFLCQYSLLTCLHDTLLK